MRVPLAVIVLFMLLMTASAQAQWTADSSMGVALGFGQALIVGVGCASEAQPVVSVRFADDSSFSTGIVVASFDDGDPLDVELANRGQQLNGVASAGVGREFVRLLIRSGSLTLGVGRRGQELPVVDVISLRGSGSAIRSLSCVR